MGGSHQPGCQCSTFCRVLSFLSLSWNPHPKAGQSSPFYVDPRERCLLTKEGSPTAWSSIGNVCPIRGFNRLFLERIGRICFSNSEGRDKYAMRWLWKISLKETNNYGASSMLQILGQMLHKLFPLIWSWTSCLMMDGSNGSPFDGWGNADLARRLRTDPGPASA